MWKSQWGGVLGAEAPRESFFFSREPLLDFLCLAKIIVSFPKLLLKFQDTSLPTPNPVAGRAWPRLTSRQDGSGTGKTGHELDDLGTWKGRECLRGGYIRRTDVGEELPGSRVQAFKCTSLTGSVSGY
jgi:hypothetical protein